jgi:hypothetical protein
MVSSRMPSATAKPSSAANTSGSVTNTAKVPVQDQTRRGDDGAGGGQPGDCATPGTAPVDLLAYPGHQEDVVVDPGCDQEHEHDHREHQVDTGKPEGVIEHEPAHAERGRERQHRARVPVFISPTPVAIRGCRLARGGSPHSP